MEDLISIENSNLADYAMFKLDKLDNSFTKEELAKITEVVIDYNNESDLNFLEELLKFPNLTTITIRNGHIFNDNYNIFLKLNSLNDFTFENCDFENADLIASLKLNSLSLVNCRINNYSFLKLFKNLEKLTIINGEIPIAIINSLTNLKYLQLSYSNITNCDDINIKSLEELYIDNTNIHDFNFLNSLLKLKRLSIDEKQYNNNKELFNNLLKKDILVLNENMVEFAGEYNEI